MMPRQTPLSLADNLNQHIVCAEALLSLLAEEKAALLNNDLAGLEKICESKSAAAGDLQTLSLSLNRLCGAQDGAGVERFIRNSGDTAQLQHWQTLTRLAARCQQSNLENGSLLQLRQNAVRSMMGMLQREERPLYGRRGHVPHSSGRRALAQA